MEENFNPAMDQEVFVNQLDIEIHESDTYDYSNLSKSELIEEIKKIKTGSVISISRNQLSDLKENFENIFEVEKQKALQDFLESGGEKDGFEYQDPQAQTFFEALKDVNSIRKKHKEQLEDQRKGNTLRKKVLLEKLRSLIDGDEGTQTFNQVKEIQKEWKEIGAINQSDYQEFNASYHAILDRYYSFRSIYFDLKNLDKDKNLLQKRALVSELKALLEYPNTLEAVKKIADIHTQFKSLGPVPEEHSEALWEEFKLVTQQVRNRREEFLKEQSGIQEANVSKKLAIIEKAQSYAEKNVNSIKEWKSLSDELSEIQGEFKKAGLVPEEKKKEVNDAFWAICRQFYNNKGIYFSQLDEQRKSNHEKKLALIAKAESIKNHENFKDTAEKIKKLQAEWKTIGQSPKAVNEKVYQEFRAVCDYFFEKRSQFFNDKEKEFDQNSILKKEVIEKITKLSGSKSLTEFEQFLDAYFKIGMVPKNDMNAIQKSFQSATQGYIATCTDMDEESLQKLKLSVELGAVKGTSEEQNFIQNKTRQLRNKISAIQEEIATLNNNVEFFANSKNIDSIRKEVNQKVEGLNAEVTKIKSQLAVLK